MSSDTCNLCPRFVQGEGGGEGLADKAHFFVSLFSSLRKSENDKRELAWVAKPSPLNLSQRERE